MAKRVAVGPSPMDRRDFLNYFIGMAMLVWGGFATATVFKVVTPPERRLDGSMKLGWLAVGEESTFTDAPKPVAYGDETVYVYKLNGNLVAFSATCPHVRCVVKWFPAEGVYHCPCHGSTYDKGGKRLYGPTPRGLWAQEIKVQGGQVMLGGGTPPA